MMSGISEPEEGESEGSSPSQRMAMYGLDADGTTWFRVPPIGVKRSREIYAENAEAEGASGDFLQLQNPERRHRVCWGLEGIASGVGRFFGTMRFW